MINKLVIDRAMWGQEYLLNPEPSPSVERGPVGSMCCLGWLSKAAGITDQEMIGLSYPHRDWSGIPRRLCEPQEGDLKNTRLILSVADRDNAWPAHAAAFVNDSEKVTLEEKETMLIELFKVQGIELSFVGVHWSVK